MIDSVVIWDPEELDLIHQTQAVDFVIHRDEFNRANFDEIQGKAYDRLKAVDKNEFKLNSMFLSKMWVYLFKKNRQARNSRTN